MPRAARIAVLWNADDRGMTLRYQHVEKAAQMLHVTVQPLGVREPDDFEQGRFQQAIVEQGLLVPEHLAKEGWFDVASKY